jgi:pyruvate kinase
MLNKGPNLLAGVAALDRLLARMGAHQSKKTPTLRALRSWDQESSVLPIQAQAVFQPEA